MNWLRLKGLWSSPNSLKFNGWSCWKSEHEPFKVLELNLSKTRIHDMGTNNTDEIEVKDHVKDQNYYFYAKLKSFHFLILYSSKHNFYWNLIFNNFQSSRNKNFKSKWMTSQSEPSKNLEKSSIRFFSLKPYIIYGIWYMICNIWSGWVFQ